MIRPWRPSDVPLMQRASNGMSLATLSARFFTGTSQLPPTYLEHMLTAASRQWDAVVAVDGDDIIGWAEYGRDQPWSSEADLGVLVTDRWQRRGLGPELAIALIPLAQRAGISTLRAEVQATNIPALRFARSFFGQGVITDADGDVVVFRADVRWLAERCDGRIHGPHQVLAPPRRRASAMRRLSTRLPAA